MSGIDAYELLRELGAGSFGTVYEGRDRETGRAVAVKILHPTQVSPASRGQLLAEAEALRAVGSDHVVRVVDVVQDESTLALVTDLVPGASLRVMLDQHGPLAPLDALVVMEGAARGLVAVHAAGLVHGDVKPANIVVEPDGTSRLIDFGLASVPGLVAHDAASVWGSPAYAAPEQILHGYRDGRSDVYALTVTLYELLCGRRPFEADSVEEVRDMHVRAAIPDPRLLVHDLGDELTQLLFWGLAKEADQRPGSVEIWHDFFTSAVEARWGRGWQSAAAVGSVAGSMTAAGLLASGVLVPAQESLAPLAGDLPLLEAPPEVAVPAGGEAIMGAEPAVAAGETVTHGLLSSVGAKIAVAATTAVVVGGGATLVGLALTGDEEPRVEAPVATPVVTSPPAAEGVEKIAFQRCESSDDCSIHSIDADGANEVRLTDGQAPAWSPDGERLAFHRFGDGSASIFVMPVGAGSVPGEPVRIEVEGITASTYLLGPSWSPDGSTIAAFQSNGTVSSTYGVTIPADGGPFTEADGFAEPSWSPDGSSFVGLLSTGGSGPARTSVLAHAPVGGGEATVLLDESTTGGLHARWSTKDLISYTVVDSAGSESVWTMRPDGTDARRITDGAAAAWSPDGSRLAFHRCDADGGACTLHTIDLESGDESEIGRGSHPSWVVVPESEPAAVFDEPVRFDPPLVFDQGRLISGDAAVLESLPADLVSYLEGGGSGTDATARNDGSICPPEEVQATLESFHPEGFAGGSLEGCGLGEYRQVWVAAGGWRNVVQMEAYCDQFWDNDVPEFFVETCFDPFTYEERQYSRSGPT